MDGRPIGMFDSGFGGLTVARALIDLAPHEDLVYVGDTGRYPYGPRDLDEVRSFAVQIARWLIDDIGVKLVVVACNTASAAALDTLRALLPVPVVGVIDPGVRALAKATRNRRVGVVGTVGTIRSGAYQRAIGALPVPLELVPASCPGFVEFVERGETRSDQVSVLAERLLAPVRDAGVDALLLGCTHYPFLARTIADVLGRDVVLVSSADETAFEVRAILGGSQSPGLGADAGDGGAGGSAEGRLGALSVFSSGDVAWFRAVGSRLFGGELGEVRQVSWPDPPAVADVVPGADGGRGVGGGRPGAASG
ncbi:MAG TPA: glutamate racemase [Acidimicrobiales bacterium]|nr:glutamate racemase [Acidimicrobiales bacterium]